jgi:CRP/FNR family transcriptional regulator, cyclic AMP receptor protein
MAPVVGDHGRSGDGEVAMTDVVTQDEQEPTLGERIAEASTQASGTMTFFLINAALFAVWIVLNVLTPWRFDAYPFAFLTLSVSLEAIFLSILVLISQNRQAAYDRRLNEHDAQTNRRTEKKIDTLDQDMQSIKRMLAKAVVES